MKIKRRKMIRRKIKIRKAAEDGAAYWS
jgi:hypothetical protein